MKFWEAMRLLQEGKKVRCNQWPPNMHLDSVKRNFCVKWEGKNYDSSFLDEWELYEEKIKLSFAAVVEGLKLGKKYTRTIWGYGHKGSYISLFQGFITLYINYSTGTEQTGFHPLIDDLEANDWIEVKD